MPKTEVKVRLAGEDGNAFAILARVRRAMQRAQVEPALVEQYLEEAVDGDYAHLLRVTMDYVEVE